MSEETAPPRHNPLILLVALVALTPWHGFVLSQLWTWFGEPLTGAHLSPPHAIGIIVLLSIARGSRSTTREDEPPYANVIALSVVMPALNLAIGYAAHRFMVGAP